jgi:predicted Na+-dependent transporter
VGYRYSIKYNNVIVFLVIVLLSGALIPNSSGDQTWLETVIQMGCISILTFMLLLSW